MITYKYSKSFFNKQIPNTFKSLIVYARYINKTILQKRWQKDQKKQIG